MEHKLENGILTVFLTGRVDSGNAAEVEAALVAVRQGSAHESLVLDLEGLSYISSAGLRVILRTRKAEPTLKLINASAEVYEIFDMTGFTEMIPVEKAYRRFSVEGCEVIGQGANGRVYRIDADTIIKVYFNPDALPDIQRERELARKAFVLGIPTAIPYDVVKVGDGFGSVFELLNAQSFSKLIDAEPEKLEFYAGLYVKLMKKLHSTEVRPEDMPDMRQVALNWAAFLKDYLPADKFEKLYRLVEQVPVVHTMLHGDYHIKNVMMQNGEVLLIDMDTLCYGHPVFELASVFLAYDGFGAVDPMQTVRFMGLPREITLKLWQRTLALYFGTEDEQELARFADKAKVIGYTRLLRRTIRRNGFGSEEGRALIEACRSRLITLIDRVDSLSF